MSDDERTARYVRAIFDDQAHTYDLDEVADVTEAVMAVADAELAELREQRAEWMRAASDRMTERDLAERTLADERARWAVSDAALREATERAEAAEAKVVRVEALAQDRDDETDNCYHHYREIRAALTDATEEEE